MSEQLKLMLDIFETKVNELEEEYRKMHREDFSEDKMKRYINNKLKKEMRILTFCNIMPSLEALKNSERFKY